jgi:hypothetical protein
LRRSRDEGAAIAEVNQSGHVPLSHLVPHLGCGSTEARIIHTRLNASHFCESPWESSLYLPVKRFLGFEVKGEVCGSMSWRCERASRRSWSSAS